MNNNNVCRSTIINCLLRLGFETNSSSSHAFAVDKFAQPPLNIKDLMGTLNFPLPIPCAEDIKVDGEDDYEGRGLSIIREFQDKVAIAIIWLAFWEDDEYDLGFPIGPADAAKYTANHPYVKRFLTECGLNELTVMDMVSSNDVIDYSKVNLSVGQYPAVVFGEILGKPSLDFVFYAPYELGETYDEFLDAMIKFVSGNHIFIHDDLVQYVDSSLIPSSWEIYHNESS